MENIKYTYEDVNKGMRKVLSYLEETKWIWEPLRDLKLHECFFQLEDILNEYPLIKENWGKDNCWNWFVEAAYSGFLDWIKEDGITDRRDYIGRTSKFYLTKIHDRKEYIVDNLLGEVCGSLHYLDFDSDGKMQKLGWGSYSEEEILDFAQEEMRYFAETGTKDCFLSDVKSFMEDAEKIASYIDDYKINQVKYMREVFQNNESILEESRAFEEEKKREIETASMACYI